MCEKLKRNPVFRFDRRIDYGWISGEQRVIDLPLLWELNRKTMFDLRDDMGRIVSWMTLREMYEQSDNFDEEVADSVHARWDRISEWATEPAF
jgi:hypothetical protein